MILSKNLVRFGSLAVLILFTSPILAEEKEKVRTEQIAEFPAEIKLASPALSTVFFFETGTNNNLQTVKAGEKFDMVVYLNGVAAADTQITSKSFRLDISGLDSGSVKVIPIVVGDEPDEKYWAVAPPSPFVIKRGNVGVRLRGLQVLRNAKQPPEGNVTKPFEPVAFPDHVIMFVKLGDVTLAPTLRVAKP